MSLKNSVTLPGIDPGTLPPTTDITTITPLPVMLTLCVQVLYLCYKLLFLLYFKQYTKFKPIVQ